jgi:hypothetical protein
LLAAILGLVGCQRAQKFGPWKIGTEEIDLGKTLESRRECGAAKIGLRKASPTQLHFLW